MRGTTILLIAALMPSAIHAQSSAHGRPGLIRAFMAYDSTFRTQNPTAIAAWFLPTGEMGSVGHPAIIGPDSIAAQLERFAAYRLLASRLTPDSILVHGDSGWINGNYWQRVRLPAGDTVEAHGTFTAIWAWRTGGGWRIRRLLTDP